MFFDRSAPFFRNIKCSVRNVGGARTGGRGASLFGGSHAETPAELKLHDFFNWFYRMRMPDFNRNLFVLNIFHKINVINFYFRRFSFSILGKKEVWPSWLEHLLWIQRQRQRMCFTEPQPLLSRRKDSLGCTDLYYWSVRPHGQGIQAVCHTQLVHTHLAHTKMAPSMVLDRGGDDF